MAGDREMKSPTPSLSRRERQVLDLLYEHGEATVAEVRASLDDPPSYSAVRAILRILEEKGHIAHREDGPRYVFRPIVPRDQARESALRHLLQTFFEGSASGAVTALLDLDEAALSVEEHERLLARVEKARREGR